MKCQTARQTTNKPLIPNRRKMPSFKTALDRETGFSVVEMGADSVRIAPDFKTRLGALVTRHQ